jgi:hypothetical protein
MRTPSTHATVHLIDTDPCIRCRVCGDKAKPDDDFVSLDIADAGVLANPRHLRKIRDIIDRWLASPDGVRLTAIETAKLAAMGGVVTPPDGWTRDERGNLRGPRGTTIFRKRSGCPKHAIAFNPSDPAWQPGADYPTESAALEAARAILAETAEAACPGSERGLPAAADAEAMAAVTA